MLIDGHAHLYEKDYDNDRDNVIAHAINSGLQYILNVATGFEALKKSILIAEKYDFIYLAAGVHPHYSVEEDCEKVIKLLDHPKIVAIGEIGMDFFRDYSPRDRQEEVFRIFLKESVKRNLPVIIHQRNAQEDVKKIILEELKGKRKGVMHCFSGDSAWAKECIKMGFLISFAGNITYPKATALREVAKEISIDNMLIETDCPWLAPQKFRGQRCEPAYVQYTAEEIAKIKGLTIEDVKRVTGHNFRQMFKIGNIKQNGKIAYKIRNSLYLNITNRCTSECTFCVKNYKDFVKGHYLRIEKEPGFSEIIKEIGDPKKYEEIVFCGYGEPTIRLDVVKEVSKWVKDKGGRIRIDTNGHGNLINQRPIAKELKDIVDSISVSLNADNEEGYEKLCKPIYGKKTFEEVRKFIIECKKYISDVSVTVVDMPGVNIEKCKKIADELGIKLRIRKYDEVG